MSRISDITLMKGSKASLLPRPTALAYAVISAVIICPLHLSWADRTTRTVVGDISSNNTKVTDQHIPTLDETLGQGGPNDSTTTHPRSTPRIPLYLCLDDTLLADDLTKSLDSRLYDIRVFSTQGQADPGKLILHLKQNEMNTKNAIIITDENGEGSFSGGQVVAANKKFGSPWKVMLVTGSVKPGFYQLADKVVHGADFSSEQALKNEMIDFIVASTTTYLASSAPSDTAKNEPKPVQSSAETSPQEALMDEWADLIRQEQLGQVAPGTADQFRKTNNLQTSHEEEVAAIQAAIKDIFLQKERATSRANRQRGVPSYRRDGD